MLGSLDRLARSRIPKLWIALTTTGEDGALCVSWILLDGSSDRQKRYNRRNKKIYPSGGGKLVRGCIMGSCSDMQEYRVLSLDGMFASVGWRVMNVDRHAVLYLSQ
jgi:hypothetical protein